jgi:predicted  nucleic acid-binding Zn-ribbon protein
VIQTLTHQLRSTEEGYKASQEECNGLREHMSQVSVDLTESRAELNQVLLSLEELALSYDSKDKEVQKTLSAKLLLQEEVERLQVSDLQESE